LTVADKTDGTAPDDAAVDAPDVAEGASTINSQVTDAITAINTLTEGLGPSTSAAMLSVMGADSIALAMLNAVARQQADATIASAALASVCARLAGTCLPEDGGAATPAQFAAGAEAQAQAAIMLLRSQAGQEGEAGEAARAALVRLAAAAAPAKAGKSGAAA
jgi:hypothetical protein